MTRSRGFVFKKSN